jgi:hypothetical protein
MKYKILSTILLPGLAVLVIAIGVTANRSSAQDSAGPAAKDADRANRLAEMKKITGSFQTVVIDEGAHTPVPQLREPLHRWSDPTRENNDGALWAWRAAGRPIAIMAIELYPHDKSFGTVWAIEFVSLSTGPIKVEGGEDSNLLSVGCGDNFQRFSAAGWRGVGVRFRGRGQPANSATRRVPCRDSPAPDPVIPHRRAGPGAATATISRFQLPDCQ